MKESKAVRILQVSTTFLLTCVAIWNLLNPWLPKESNFKLNVGIPQNIGFFLFTLVCTAGVWRFLEFNRQRSLKQED